MRRKTAIAMTAALVILFSGASVQSEEPAAIRSLGEPTVGAPDLSSALGGMFDPTRFSMNQAYSVSFLSDGGTSRTFGVYSNMISYALADPLQLNLRLDYVHDPSRIFKSNGNQSFDGELLPSFSLVYQPSKSVMLRFDYLQGSYRSWGFPGGSWFENP